MSEATKYDPELIHSLSATLFEDARMLRVRAAEIERQAGQLFAMLELNERHSDQQAKTQLK